MRPLCSQSDGCTRVLVALLRYEVEHGYAPPLRELAAITRLPLTNVKAHVHNLRAIGAVDFEDRFARTLHSTVAVVIPKAVA